MKIQVGQVKYKGRDDYQVVYGTTDSGKVYYFLDDTVLANNARIGSTELIEAIDKSIKPSRIGLVDENGKEVIPFDNKMIKLISNGVLIVEKSVPVSENVKSIINLRNDPTAATKLVSTPAAIKDKLSKVISSNARYVFNDLFSEAYICDLNGKPLVEGYYSFIVVDGSTGKIYMSKNDVDSQIVEYSILPINNQQSDNNAIDVTESTIPQDVVENALSSESNDAVNVKKDESIVNKPIESLSTENVVAQSSEQGNVTEVKEEGLKETANNEISSLPIVQDGDDAINEETKSNLENLANKVVEEEFIPKDTSKELNSPVTQEVASHEESVEEVQESTNTTESSDVAPIEEKDDSNSREDAIDEETKTNSETLVNKVTEEEFIPKDTSKEPTSSITQEVASHEENVEEVQESTNTTKSSDVAPAEEKDDSTQDKVVKKDLFNNNQLSDNVLDIHDEVTDSNLDNYNDKLNSFDTSDISDDLLKDSEVKADKIDMTDDYFDLPVNKKTDESSNIIEDVAKSMTELMNQIRQQKNLIDKYRSSLKQSELARKDATTRLEEQSEMVRSLSSRLRLAENSITKYETRCQILESKVHDQNSIIESQNREISIMRPQLEGKDELAKVLRDAQTLLHDDSYQYNDKNYTRRRYNGESSYSYDDSIYSRRVA